MKDIQAITEKLGIKLNEMQNAAVKAILHGDKDVVILSPTGSGKTLAYLLPSSQLLDKNLDALQMIVITPGRELASQSASVLKRWEQDSEVWHVMAADQPWRNINSSNK